MNDGIYCPLSMFFGHPTECENNCAFCPPQDFERIARNTNKFDYLECLNYPDDMFGTGASRSGLDDVAGAISELASAVSLHE